MPFIPLKTYDIIRGKSGQQYVIKGVLLTKNGPVVQAVKIDNRVITIPQNEVDLISVNNIDTEYIEVPDGLTKEQARIILAKAVINVQNKK